MTQALRIFSQALRIWRKDFDYLRVEVAIFVLLAVVFVWMRSHILNDEWSEPLLALAGAWLAARAVHADAIPGDRQFWLTRPYNRRSLIAAKLLFVAVCISLPVAIAELTVALSAGFTFKEAVPPLLFSQLLLFIFGGLPVVALAALTSGVVPFILIAITLALIAMGGTATLESWFPTYADSLPGPVEWIRSMLFAIPVAALTILVLARQYRSRATDSSRIIAIAGLNLAALLFLFVPASFALKAQSWLSKKPDLASRITVTAFRTGQPAAAVRFADREAMAVPFALVADHLPPNVELRADNLVLFASWQDRPVTFMRQPGIERRGEQNGQATFAVSMMVNQPQFYARLQQPLTIKGSLYLTLFGDEEKSLVSLRAQGATTQDGLRCQAARLSDRGTFVPAPPGEQPKWLPADSIVCASLFQWPRKLVYAEAGDYHSDFSNTRISYAPFPWGLSLSPIQIRWSELVEADKVTILTRKPLAHFRRDFELTGVKFGDLEMLRFMPAPVRPPADGRPIQ